MNRFAVERLLALNHRFYTDFAASFAHSREEPQPGFSLLLEYLPQPLKVLLDVGCGNGRFGRFLAPHAAQLSYVGVDFSEGLLNAAAQNMPGHYLQRDLSLPGALAGLGTFDLCVCLAAMQHIPGRANRLALLQEMAAALRPGGRIFLANWQFMDSARQRRKLADWSEIDLDPALLEQGDHLLTWQREGRGLRYVHQVDAAETDWLALQSGLRLIAQFRSDGREGDLSLYTILALDLTRTDIMST